MKRMMIFLIALVVIGACVTACKRGTEFDELKDQIKFYNKVDSEQECPTWYERRSEVEVLGHHICYKTETVKTDWHGNVYGYSVEYSE